MPTIVSRKKWGAVHDRGFRDAPLPAEEVWLHHSVTIAPDLIWDDLDGDHTDDDEESAMRQLERIGEDRFGGGISYTFSVMPRGTIFDGHGVDREGAHTAGRNGFARSIVLVGDYSSRGPTQAQKESIAWLLVHGKKQGWWRHAKLNGGHRQAPGASTACPGDAAMRAIPEINRLAAQGGIGDSFMAGLTAAQQEDFYNRVKEMDTRLTNVEAYLRPPSTWMVHAGWVPRALSVMQTRVAEILGLVSPDTPPEPKTLGQLLREDEYDEETGEVKE